MKFQMLFFRSSPGHFFPFCIPSLPDSHRQLELRYKYSQLDIRSFTFPSALKSLLANNYKMETLKKKKLPRFSLNRFPYIYVTSFVCHLY